MRYEDEPREKLNKLEKKLYSRNADNIIDEGRTELKNDSKPVNEEWESLKKNNFDNMVAKFSRTAEKKHGVVKKLFVASLSFFIIAVGIAAFVFLDGMNMVSSRNVEIRVSGPVSIAGGQEVSLDLNVVNNNNVDLENATLLVEYPEGSRSPSDLSKELDRERFELDLVKKGESFNQNIKAVFFGEKESVKEIKISLEYRVENSSALFYKDKVYELSISSAPVIITPTYQKEVNSNQEMTFDVEVASNSKDKINDLLVNIEYPFGFVFSSADPAPAFGNNIWRFNDLVSGQKRKISVSGNMVGQDNEERVFRISAGTADPDDERAIGVSFTDLAESVLIKKPFVGLDVRLGSQDGDIVAKGGSQVGGEITIQNNLPTRLFETVVEVSFSGGAFNRLSVAPSTGGFFQSFNDTILWDKRSSPALADMAPGSKFTLSFKLNPLSYANIPSGSKPEIDVTVVTRGERVLDSGQVEQVRITEKRKITLSTDLNLISRTVRSEGNLENSGPIPPRVDAKTTYTVHWRIENSFNQVSNAEVRAVLPPYVRWTGLYSVNGDSIAYNETSKEVIWSAGTILPNSGVSAPAKEIYFQLEFLPSTSQIGQTPVLLGEAVLSGIDKVVGQKIQSKAPPITTNFASDSGFKLGDDKVVQ